MTTLTFLESDRPLTKKYTKKPDGTIDKQSFLSAYHVTSHQAQITSLADFYVQLRNHADAGHCLLKGNVNRPLVQESRAGSTDALAVSDWVCLDFDGLPPTYSIDEVLQLMGIRDISYVLQWSSSQMILDDSLRCHVFFLLDRPTPAPVLKQWLVQLNHQTTFLRENLKLRLLNARLSLLSRQPEAAVADLQACQRMLSTYFDMSARRTQIAADMLRQVSSQSRLVGIPRPDDTLAATTAALAGR